MMDSYERPPGKRDSEENWMKLEYKKKNRKGLETNRKDEQKMQNLLLGNKEKDR